ncbi:MAG TPA: RiPP maturation radical SAM C-methyltransferase [Candidatus Angelobacter sp.]|jgi:ribosomal peptide maturation radical SAM protein 1
MPKRILLLVMPFITLRRPHLGVGLLKAALNRKDMECDVRYYNFRFADAIGTGVYERIAEDSPAHHMPGEFVFAPAVFDEVRPFADFKSVVTGAVKPYDDVFLQQIEHARNLSPAFIYKCAAELDLDQYDIVGFTSTFQQNLASLAMAREIKRRAPHIITVFGGANFEGEMGIELHRRFPFIDVVCSGEADDLFPELVRRLRCLEPVHEMGGVTCRLGGETVTGSTPQTFITNLNQLPYPDHADYFRDFYASRSQSLIRPEVTMETSRGCWWGQKHHCTFCGLNGLSMTYRSKTADRAYREIKHLVSMYHGFDIFNTDNIVDLRYFNELFPRLHAEGLKIQLFYETKANLKKSQLLVLKNLGSNSFQPGIESLSSHVLALMDKGVRGIQNVQLLRWSREMSFDVSWNIICGFPQETPEDYRQITRWVRAIPHLQPPLVVTRFRLDRFSPMFKDPEKYGIANVRAYRGHQICYPFPEESLRKIAYFLDCDPPITTETHHEIQIMWKAVDEWRRIHPQSTLTADVTPTSLILHDRRAGYRHADYTFAGLDRDLYLALDGVHSDSHLLELVRKKYPSAGYTGEDVRRILKEFVDHDLVLCEDNLYLALALLPLDRMEEEIPEKLGTAAERMPEALGI